MVAFHEGSSEFDRFRAAGGEKRAFPPPPAESSQILFPSPEQHSWHFLKNFRKIFWIFWKNFFWIDRHFFLDRSKFFMDFQNFKNLLQIISAEITKKKNLRFFPKNRFLSDYMVLGSQKYIFGKLRSFLKISDKNFQIFSSARL